MLNHNYATQWKNAVEKRTSMVERLRALCRLAALEGMCLVPRSLPKSMMLCITGHYVFDDQIDALERFIRSFRRVGRFVSTSECVDIVCGRRQLGDERLFHLSFDDGFRNVLDNGLPTLEKYEVPASLFVPSGFVGADYDLATDFALKENYRATVELASWDALRAVNRELFDIGAHTRQHTVLASVSDDEEMLRGEVLGAKQDIERELATECKYFAYPRGKRRHFNSTCESAVEVAGYKAAFAAFRGRCQPGAASERFRIPRQHYELQWPLRHIRTLAFSM